ncbi:family 2 encapsulin nanocompartment cargo protein terpene cyclase [Streptomyces sp. NPDC052101]|uniref:family 2 encapsulin nanocompartment cargo protein terpene cyclase n=1 Tax=Streptomyces sp. NPDC052101 TaxID=3155763 RepID=UPI00341A7EA7
MSLISRVAAPAAAHDMAGLVRALLSAHPPAPVPEPGAPGLPSGPTGLGTSAAHAPFGAAPTSPGTHTARGATQPTAPRLPLPLPTPAVARQPTVARPSSAGDRPAPAGIPSAPAQPPGDASGAGVARLPSGPTGLGTSSAQATGRGFPLSAPAGVGHGEAASDGIPPASVQLPGDTSGAGVARLPSGPTGLGTSSAQATGQAAEAVRPAEAGESAADGDAMVAGRQPAPVEPAEARQPEAGEGPSLVGLPTGPTGLGVSAAALGRTGNGASVAPLRATAAEPRREASASASSVSDPGPRLHCPPAVRDDRALGETVTARLVEWAGEMGIYPGQLDMIRQADFGRLMMLAHPETDDPDRLLAAAKCGLAEWAVDDHYVDGEVEQARPEQLGQRLAIAHSVIDQANLPLQYAPQLEEVVRADPVARALRDSLRNLHSFATTSQVRRLRHELGIMFVAYGQEGYWQASGHRPPVWEYLMHRHENSFIPCMVLVDAIAGYEIPYGEFSDLRVRRAFTLAGTATVIVNDIYSMAKEDPADFSLPRLIATEDDCSLEEAVDRTIDIHNELMLTFETEAAALARTGSPELRRFLASTWAWVGGSREWHATSGRYHGTANAA